MIDDRVCCDIIIEALFSIRHTHATDTQKCRPSELIPRSHFTVWNTKVFLR